MVDYFYGMHWMLTTPFLPNEEIDYNSIPKIVGQAKKSGCTGVVGLGVMGEAVRLTDAERTKVAEAIVSAADRLPVTLGTTANSTKAVIDRSIEAENLGSAAIMVSAPSMQNASTDNLFAHFARLAEKISIPIVMQDYPQVSGVKMPVSFITRVAKEIPQVKYLKLEDPPTPSKISSIRNRISDRLGIFGGLGGVFLLDELRRGAIGAMTGFAYPEMLVAVVALHLSGQHDQAEDIFDAYLPYVRHEQQPGFGLALRKEILYRRGIIASPQVRAPGPILNETDHKELDRLIRRIEQNVEAL